MRKEKLLISILLCLVLLCGCGSQHGELLSEASARIDESGEIRLLDTEIPLGADTTTDLCRNIFIQINNFRAENNMTSLAWSPDLEPCAQIRAIEASQLWSHTRPNGEPWWTVNEKIMYGENLAKGYTTADAVVSAWIASPSHKANLLDAGFQYVAIVEYNGYYACEFS